MAITRSAHDVVEHGGKLHDFEPLVAKIAITANISIMETEHVTKFMCQCSRREIARRQRNVPANKAMGCLRTGCQHRTVCRKPRGMGPNVEVLSSLSERVNLTNLDFQAVHSVAVLRAP